MSGKTKTLIGLLAAGALTLLLSTVAASANVPAAGLASADGGAAAAAPSDRSGEVKVAMRGGRFFVLRQRPRLWGGRHVYRHLIRRPAIRLYVPGVTIVRRSYDGYGLSRCNYWHRRCIASWGAYNSNYWGCRRYHGCD